MMIVEGLKKVKLLQLMMTEKEAEIMRHCSMLSNETPTFGSVEAQKAHIEALLQANQDMAYEAARLQLQVAYTNLMTQVTIRLGDNNVTHSIAEWILRRRTYAPMQYRAWQRLTDRGLKETLQPSSVPGAEPIKITIVRFFDPGRQAKMLELFRTEPAKIDATLETVNATTELLEVPTV